MASAIRYTTARDAPRVELEGTSLLVIPSFAAVIPPSVMETQNSVELTVRFMVHREDWDIWSLGALREDGEPPITPDSLRSIAPTEAVRYALTGKPDIIIDRDGAPLGDVWDRAAREAPERRAEGPSARNLDSLVVVYRSARVLHLPPVAKIADLFGLPQRTATHWVMLARQRGHFLQGG